jgi:hypothetical protein
MIDKLFFLVLVLNATGLFRFLAPQLGVDIGMVSLVLLGLHCCYLMAKERHVVRLLQCAELRCWLFLLLLWPLVTVLYAPAIEVREIALQAYYVSLFCAAVVYTMANGLTAMHRVMTGSLAITVFGLVLSMIMPSYFEAVARLADAQTGYHERAFGFFMQPNSAALGLVILFCGWYSMWKLKKTLWDVVAMVALLALTLVTGSRTGVIIAAVVCGMIVVDAWRVRREQGSFSSGILYAKAILLVSCMAVGGIWLNQYAASRSSSHFDLHNRILHLTSFRLSESNVMSDNSLQARLGAQGLYLLLIKERPFFGHGLGAESLYLQDGTLHLSSHSALLACWMQYGMFYPLMFTLLMVRMYFNHRRPGTERLFAANSIFQIVGITLLLFAFGALQERTFFVVLGLFFASIHWPDRVQAVVSHGISSKGLFDRHPDLLMEDLERPRR